MQTVIVIQYNTIIRYIVIGNNYLMLLGMPLALMVDINSSNVDNYVTANTSVVLLNQSPRPQKLNFTFNIPKKAIVAGIFMTLDNNKHIEKFIFLEFTL